MRHLNHRPTLLVLTTALLVLVLGLATVGGTSRAGAASDQKPPFLILVAGDSYSAGNGGGSYSGPGRCYRSAHNYAQVFAATLRKAPYNQPTLVENVACSGDITNAFSGTTSGRRPQLDAFNRGYNLIFLTIGGNDIYFKDIAESCLAPGTSIGSGRRCDAVLARAKGLLDGGSIEEAIKAVMIGIQLRVADNATVVLLGYPYLESNANYKKTYYSCDITTHCSLKTASKLIQVKVGERIQEIGLEGDRVQQAAIAAVNSMYHTNKFVFILTKDLFAGHEISATGIPNPQRWLEEPLWDVKNKQISDISYHPKPEGYAHEAAMLIKDPRVPKSPPPKSTSPGPTPSPTPSPSATQTLNTVFPVANTNEQPPDGVWFRNSPHTADTDRAIGHGVYSGDQVKLSCYAFGDAAGKYNNTLWYYVSNITRTTVPGSGANNVGYLNSHYINDGKLANQIDLGIPACNATPPTPVTTLIPTPVISPNAASESFRDWYGVASSSDGTHLVAVEYDSTGQNNLAGYIYTSTDSGLTWTRRGPAGIWSAVVSSSDGTHIAAISHGQTGISVGQIYTSMDSGVTWTLRNSVLNASAVASSSDGTHLVAAGGGLPVYTSTDSGLTWLSRGPVLTWYAVASSSEGTHLVAIGGAPNLVPGGDAQVYTSTDSGLTWAPRDLFRNWQSVASSSDGTHLVATEVHQASQTVETGHIYTSTDSGITWIPQGPDSGWYAVASSSDGTRLVALSGDGRLYSSTDSGLTWTPRVLAWGKGLALRAVASSSDGTHLVVTTGVIRNEQLGVSTYTSGDIYTSVDSGLTWTVRNAG